MRAEGRNGRRGDKHGHDDAVRAQCHLAVFLQKAHGAAAPQGLLRLDIGSLLPFGSFRDFITHSLTLLQGFEAT